jgi:phosphinothricin acetyltransferase
LPYRHRLATREDLPAIVDIYNRAVLEKASTCDVEPVSTASRQAWFLGSDPRRHPVWVGHEASDPDTVTGYLTIDPFLNGRPGYDVTSDVALYLHPDHRGRGQGAHLLDEAVARAPDLGARTLATTIFASNEASLRLFRSRGFQEWGRLPGVADLGGGAVHDVVFVGRPVAPSSP